jgi:hypothetical protein
MNIVEDPDSEHATNPQLLSALTTEHYTLQSARSSTIVEANGRSSLFLSATSAATVALALVAQLDRLGSTFMVFTLVVLPALLVLGLTSYARLADLAVHDAYYARAIGRIRAFYLTLDPAGAQYWMQPAGDDPHAVMRQAGQQHTRWHHFSHTATSVAAVTAVVAGALIGLVLTQTVSLPVPLVATISAVASSGMFALTWLDQERRWNRSAMAEATRFLPDGAPAPAPARVLTSPAVPAREPGSDHVPAVA